MAAGTMFTLQALGVSDYAGRRHRKNKLSAAVASGVTVAASPSPSRVGSDVASFANPAVQSEQFG
jgi:hypothetical protein